MSTRKQLGIYKPHIFMCDGRWVFMSKAKLGDPLRKSANMFCFHMNSIACKLP